MTISHDFQGIGEGQSRQALEVEEKRGRSIEDRLASIGNHVASYWGPLVVLDFLIGISLMFVGYNVTASLPGGMLTAVVMIVVGMCRPATIRIPWASVMMMILAALLVFLAWESIHNGMRWTQRIEKFVLVILAGAMVGFGRINIRSLIIGGLAGELLNVPMFYAHLTPNDYPPYLTGFYLDKNVAGMYYAVWGCLALVVLPKKWVWPWIGLSFVLLYLTGSRTSLAAYSLGLGWIALRMRVGIFLRVILGLIGYYLLNYFETNFAKNSAFGDRTGDDWFRSQIEAAMSAKAAITPWYGMGLNQGFVMLGGVRQAFFHNSYLQAFVEGGWPFIIVVVLAFSLIGLGIFDRRIQVPTALVRLEGSIVVILVCAWKLGEVFMTLGAFLVLGMAMAYRLGQPIAHKDLSEKARKRAEARGNEFDFAEVSHVRF